MGVILYCLIVYVYATCRKRCNLSLESIGYRTCVKEGTGCKQSLNGADRCYEKLPATKIPFNVQRAATISVSSTRSHDRKNYDKENIFSGDSQRCFSTESEQDPFLEISFQQTIVIEYMLIKGRADAAINKVHKNLENIEIWFNGVKIPESVFEHNANTNIVTATGSELNVKTIKFTRPKPKCETKWFLSICDVEIYVSGGFK